MDEKRVDNKFLWGERCSFFSKYILKYIKIEKISRTGKLDNLQIKVGFEEN